MMNNYKFRQVTGVAAILLFLAIDGQAQDDSKSTDDLSFLMGSWEIDRIYRPGSEEERTMKGTLSCEKAMDDQFIRCTYEMIRPGKIRALDEVYFNYNSIYDQYESLWLSSTWPVKVLMQGSLEEVSSQKVLKTRAQFSIGDGVMEFVVGELKLEEQGGEAVSFSRKTHIRTSKDAEGIWLHHMTERAMRKRE